MSSKEQIALRLPPAALSMVDELVGSIYGTSRAEVARALLLDQLKRLAAEKIIQWRVQEPTDASEEAALQEPSRGSS